MTDKNQKLVEDLRAKAQTYPIGALRELLFEAADSIESLSKDNQRLLDANKLLNDKCERLMEEVKRLEYVTGDRPEYAGPDTKAGEAVQLKGVKLNPEDMKGIPVLGDLGFQLRIKDEEIAKLKEQLAAANDATVSRDATIRKLREDVRRIGVESNDFRNRMIREQNLVSQLVAALEGLANRD